MAGFTLDQLNGIASKRAAAGSASSPEGFTLDGLNDLVSKRTELESRVDERYREMMKLPVTVDGKEYSDPVEAQVAYSRTFTPGSEQYRKFVDDVWAALRQDARNSVLLDEYNRQSEENRPKAGDQDAYDALIEKGRAKYAGGAFASALTGFSSLKQNTPKADTTYRGPTYDEVHRNDAPVRRVKKQDSADLELERILNAPKGRPVGLLEDSGDVITVGGTRRRGTAEERATRERPEDYGVKIEYKKIDPFGVL